MAINRLEKVNINNSEQWVLVRGNSVDAPLIIHVQAGPGLPMIPESSTMERLFHLEDKYVVAYWDQRGCGKSFTPSLDPKTINFAHLTDDVIACTRYLLTTYKKDKAILIGYSIGATLSLMAAVKESSLFSNVFLVGIDIDIPTANSYALEFAMKKAKAGNKARLLKEVLELQQTPILDTKKFQQRAKLLTNLNGIKTGSSYNQLLIATIKNMLFSKEYTLADIPKTISGMEFCQNALLPELDTLNLFRAIKEVHVPTHFIQGVLDGIAPFETALKFYNHLQSDQKTFTNFEHSAHLPHYEEPEKFVQLLEEILTTQNG